LVFIFVRSIPPTAPTRRPVRGVADQEAEAERDGRGGVWILFHELAQEITSRNGSILDSFGTVDRGLRGLAVGTFQRARDLADRPFKLRRRSVAHLLRPAANAAKRAARSFVHHQGLHSGTPCQRRATPKVPQHRQTVVEPVRIGSGCVRLRAPTASNREALV